MSVAFERYQIAVVYLVGMRMLGANCWHIAVVAQSNEVDKMRRENERIGRGIM